MQKKPIYKKISRSYRQIFVIFNEYEQPKAEHDRIKSLEIKLDSTFMN